MPKKMGLAGGKCTSNARLDGKTAIITGSNVGIGQYTAQDFYKRGCRVIMACRNEEKAEIARQEIYERTKGVSNVGTLVIAKVDVASLQSIREFAEMILKTESQINILINNAAIGGLDWDDMNAEKTFSTSRNYSLSKLANILFTKELAQRLEGTGVNVYSLHPGFVNTDISRSADRYTFPGAAWLYKNVAVILQKTVKQGSQTTIHCAVDEKAGTETGLYYADCQPARTSKVANNPENAKKMWDFSMKMVKLEDYDPFEKINTRL